MPYRMLVCWRVSGIHYTDYTWYTSNLHSITLFSGWIPSYPLNLQFPRIFFQLESPIRPSSDHLPGEKDVPKGSHQNFPSRWKVTVLSYIGHLQLKGQGEVLGSLRDSPVARLHHRVMILVSWWWRALDVHIYIHYMYVYMYIYIYIISFSLSLCISIHVKKCWE